MATPTHRLLLLLSILLGLLATAATARPGRYFHPCKTLILFTSSSSSYPLNQSPNFPLENPESPSPKPRRHHLLHRVQSSTPNPPSSLRTPPSSSIAPPSTKRIDLCHSDSTPPWGLLGCGAITATTFYLMWSLLAGNRFDFRDSDDEYDEEDSDDGEYDDVSPKKMGYVAIPVAAAPAKEVA
ncbi:hypothetical protein Acr_05g0014300 [Actinidia rufa]|uniref:Transmembrane protein n=1 Tax=Actinidia rufa TaxID=165716 RepID=A0A7J0EMU3_9ERIC|nr:hypothetical protein Acr_05g0014300 [Actinidia rufa]